MKDKYLILYETGKRDKFGLVKNCISGLTEEDVLTVTAVLDDLCVKYQIYVLDFSK